MQHSSWRVYRPPLSRREWPRVRRPDDFFQLPGNPCLIGHGAVRALPGLVNAGFHFAHGLFEVLGKPRPRLDNLGQVGVFFRENGKGVDKVVRRAIYNLLFIHVIRTFTDGIQNPVLATG